MEQKYLIFVFFLTTATTTTFAEDVILSVTQVFRHGERTPIIFYPTDPYQDSSYWNGLSPGQLTENGRVQLTQLGQYFRERYGDFLSRKYVEDEIYVKTVSGERNYVSAESFLTGLYPAEEVNIPIVQTSAAIMGSLVECLHYDILYAGLEMNNDYFKSINDENSIAYEHIRTNSEFPVFELLGAYMMWDTLHIESRVNYTLPEWTDSVFPNTLTQLSDVFASSLCFDEDQQRLAVGPFLNELINYFESVITDASSTKKVQLYSVHDVNIACLLNTFGAFKPHVPDFASSLIFELRQIDENHYINAYYKPSDQAIPITIKGCNFNCKLEDFKNTLSDVIINELEWDLKCYTPF